MRNEVKSAGAGGGGLSLKRVCRGVALDAARVRAKLCRSVEKPLDVDEDRDAGVGDEGLCGLGGDAGITPRDAVADAGLKGVAFFFALKGRKKDQSDSNWTDSNSEASGEWSRRAASRSSSILRSANRIMNTASVRTARTTKEQIILPKTELMTSSINSKVPSISQASLMDSSHLQR